MTNKNGNKHKSVIWARRLQEPTPDVGRHCHVRFPLGYQVSLNPRGDNPSSLLPFPTVRGPVPLPRLGLAGPSNSSTIILLVLAVLVVKMDGGSSTPNTASTAPPNVRALLDAWFSFHIIGGHFLVPVLITTFLFSKAKRDATLINFGITIILSSITNCLLLYAHEYLGPEPNKTLCIFQAAAFGASAPMWSVAALTLVLQIRSRVELRDVRWLFVMLMMPYIAFITFSVVILVVGLQRPDTVTRARRTLYCSMEWRSLSLVSIGFTSVNALVAFGFGASMCYQICDTLRMVRQVQRTQIRIIPVAIRLLIFLAYIFFALVTSVLSIWDRHTYARDIYTSTFGVAYFVVFGSQHDVLWAWCFWRKMTRERGPPLIRVRGH
ncbi:hypothetical protein BJV77DRAFT_254309 [Russula vinacea]|nr:hypothetical protein BJV77DRAFT_254309 [Russula vinacea]